MLFRSKYAWGNDSLNGKKVLVQGAGNVGQYLIDHLIKEGANVLVSDIFEDKLTQVTSKHVGVTVINAEDVYSTQMDVYAPCALGATLNDQTLESLRCQIVAGAANNQLQNEKIHGRKIIEKGILYAPDFLINSGGVINCYREVAGLDENWSIAKTEDIYNTTLNIFKVSTEKNIPTFEAANILAEERIEKEKNKN